jgi:rRNA maturation RNase YbeY
MKKNILITTPNIELEIVGNGSWVKRHDILSLINPATWALSQFLYKSLKIKDTFALSLQIVDDKKMKQINKKFRGKDSTTDVLSFPLQQSVRNKNFESYIGKIELGDIIISSNLCLKQAKEFKLTTKEEFVHLFIHGFLHLLGYDHEISKKEDKMMKKIEENILKNVTKLKKKAPHLSGAQIFYK